MGMIFIKVIEMSVAATFLMVAVILLRIPLKKAPKWFMGVLWAIVALRLIMPFQIEADFGLLPNIGGMIEEYIYGSGNGSQVTEVVLHDYQPSSSLQSGWMAGIDENEAIIPETADEEMEYLPSEEITTVDTASHDNMTLRKDLFIRLQMIWMFGGLIVLGYALLSYLSIKKKTRVSIRMKGSDNAFVCDEIDTPFILGVFRPVIYLPSGLNDETVRNVLAHEKAHISRCDHVRKQFGFLLLAIHWFNPLVWISYALFCKDIELSCDEKVISHMSLDEKKSYATSLLLCSTHRRFVLAYPLAFGEVGVGTRVKQIFNYKKPTFWLIVMLVLMCAGLSTCFFTSVAEDANDSNVLNIKQTRDGLVRRWCEDFMDRNAEGIVNACTKEVQQTLIEEQLLMRDEDGDSFGWSSPWPGMLTGDISGSVSYSVLYGGIGNKGIEIIYRATDSEPHLYLWKEYLGIEADENGDLKITSEEFKEMTDIENYDDFMDAYYSGINIDEMDYSKNGLGEDLNQNAKEDTKGLYAKLFDPVSSARYLLNLSEDESKVVVSAGEDTEDGTLVSISFIDDNIAVNMLMIQPWGSDGIYVPVQCDSDESAGWDSDDEEVSYIIENDDRVHSNSNGNVNSTELPNYIKGSGEKFINLPFSDGEDYFENAHEHKSMTDGYSEEADLNGDGKKEKIKVIDLGYQGGDGGYEPHVYGADGKELALPADTRQEPFSLKWTNGNAYVMRDDIVIASLTKDQVHELYLKKGYTEDELEELEDIFNEDEVIVGDDASGFAIGNKDGKPELIVKYLLSGKQGHADTFGYVLLHLTLNDDGTWNETPEYVTDLD